MTRTLLRQAIEADLYSPEARDRDDGRSQICVEIEVVADNAEHIATAFGAEVAEAAIAQLAATLSLQFRDNGIVFTAGDGRIHAKLADLTVLGAGPLPAACGRFLRDLCIKVAISPLQVADFRLCLAVSGQWNLSVEGNSRSGRQQNFARGGFPR